MKGMTKGRGWQIYVGVVVLAALASLVACAGVPVSGTPPSQAERPAKSDAEVLRERAQAYWQARLMDDMPKAYTFEQPGLRGRWSVLEYVRNVSLGIKATAADVTEVRIDGDMADVYVDVQGRQMIPGWDKIVMRTTLVDDWQKIDGQWYHVIDFHLIRAGKPRVNPDGTVTYLTPKIEGVPQGKQ